MDASRPNADNHGRTAQARGRARWRAAEGVSHWMTQLVVLVAVTAPLIFFFMFGSDWANRQLKEQVLARRHSLAASAASALHGRFDRFASVTAAFAAQMPFRDAVSDGRWDDALAALGGLRDEMPAVDRIVLLDAGGGPKASSPGSDLDADRTTMAGLYAMAADAGGVIVSDVYRRAAEPDRNVFAIAVPIAGTGGSGPAGAVVVEVATDEVVTAVLAVDAGVDGTAYAIDRRGTIAAHPSLSARSPIARVAEGPIVEMAMAGHGGVRIIRSTTTGADEIVAVEPVGDHGWTMIVSQRASSALAPAASHLDLVYFVFGIVLAVNLALALCIMWLVRVSRDAYFDERALLENAGDGIVATDAHGRVVKMNSAAERMLGVTVNDIIGVHFAEAVAMQDEEGDAVPRTFRPVIFALKMGEKRATSVTPTYYYVRKDGSRFPVATVASPIRRRGRIAGAVVMFRDISAEKEIDRAKSEFVSLASHQLLTPLSTIKGFSHLLLEGDYGKASTDQSKALQSILGSVERMINLVDALLNVSRIELGTFSIAPEPMDVREAADTVLHDIAADIQAKALSIDRKYDADMPVIEADPNLVRIIFQNLLSNAIRYSKRGTTITVTIQKRPTVIYATVEDRGIGIPREQQAKIFEKFYRADNARVTVPDGNGLGLYIIKAILDRTGGRIWFSSTEGMGTTFKITLPLAGMAARGGSRNLNYKG